MYSVVSNEQVEAEKLVIGCLVRDESAIGQIGFLTEDDFMVPDHKQFWNRVKNGENPVEVAFAIPGMNKAFTWSNDVLYGRSGEYANVLQDKSYIREAVRVAEGIAKAATESDKDTIQALSHELVNQRAGGSSNMRSPLEIAESLNARIDKGNISIPWGMKSIDDSTRGSERGTLTVLAARPSMGKSSLAFQVNEFQATTMGLKVAVWALEMSAEQMFARRNCYKIKRMWMDVRSGHISPAEREELKKQVIGYAEWLDNRLMVNDDTSTTVSQIVRTQLRERYDVLMIDHLGLLKDKKINGERHDQYLGRLTETLHALAKQTFSVVILLAQLNRSVEGRSDKRPHMGDLRDSGQIEQNADNVALLYGDWYYDRTAEPITEVNWGKYRDGLKDTLCLVRFNMANQRFESVETREFNTYIDERIEGQLEFDEPPEIPF